MHHHHSAKTEFLKLQSGKKLVQGSHPHPMPGLLVGQQEGFLRNLSTAPSRSQETGTGQEDGGIQSLADPDSTLQNPTRSQM